MARFGIFAIALTALLASAALPATAASISQDCAVSGGVSEPVSAALAAGSSENLSALLAAEPARSADVLVAARSASEEERELLALSLAEARLSLMALGDEAGVSALSAAAACGTPEFAAALARSYRQLLVRGRAPGYTVPLFYGSFGGGLVSAN